MSKDSGDEAGKGASDHVLMGIIGHTEAFRLL